mmetsp:Transcript_40290/g.40927  ORF Transcript_40290/g.40927 Transcript_40290/m.40927 type:complete len:97 (+) Transcript_40290:535-825(+)
MPTVLSHNNSFPLFVSHVLLGVCLSVGWVVCYIGSDLCFAHLTFLFLVGLGRNLLGEERGEERVTMVGGEHEFLMLRLGVVDKPHDAVKSNGNEIP